MKGFIKGMTQKIKGGCSFTILSVYLFWALMKITLKTFLKKSTCLKNDIPYAMKTKTEQRMEPYPNKENKLW